MKKKCPKKSNFWSIFEMSVFSKHRNRSKIGFSGQIFFSKYLIFRGDAENDVYFFDRSYFLVTLKPQKLNFFDFQRAQGMPLTNLFDKNI